VRIARFRVPTGEVTFGVVEGEAGAPAEALTVAAIDDHPFGPVTFTGQRWALPDVTLLAPVLPSKVIGIGRNYAAHAAELGNEVPDAPLIFLKPNTTVIGPLDAIRLPVDSQQVEYEGELCVVIGVPVRDVPREKALDVVFGYTCGNDVTARDQQKSDGQWTRAKGHDSFGPLGPWIETVLDPSDLALQTTLDGQVRQDARTSLLLHDVPTIVSYVSHVMTLLPGDVIMTGTPAGVGKMTAGQTVSVTIEGIGTLTNTVRERS
jgi:2-keto-4-pentenoate hydratase/2-oxohepta-3-ene-1,7-dioic acid hydratase in catechol pathway